MLCHLKQIFRATTTTLNCMEENVWQLREIVRKIGMLQRRTDKITTFLNERIEQDDVSDDLLRALSSPIEELEWRITTIERNIWNED